MRPIGSREREKESGKRSKAFRFKVCTVEQAETEKTVRAAAARHCNGNVADTREMNAALHPRCVRRDMVTSV